MADNKRLKIDKGIIVGGLIFSLFLCIFVIFARIISIQVYSTRKAGKGDVLITPYSTTDSNGNLAEPHDSDDYSSLQKFNLDNKVRVSGTGNDGLRMRKYPGINEEILYLAGEGEALKIIDGPKIIESQIWWGLISLDDPKKSGWSVQDYLEPLE